MIPNHATLRPFNTSYTIITEPPTMKILVYFAALAALAYACERPPAARPLPAGYNTHILEDVFVVSIAFGPDGTAWVGTLDRGLIHYSAGEALVYDASNSEVIDTAWIPNLALDSKGGVWMSNGGLLHFNGSTFTRYSGQNSPLVSDYVGALAIDNRDVVWVSNRRSREGELLRFDGENWEAFTQLNSSLSNYFIHDICVDHNDKVWLAVSQYVGDTRLVRISGNELHAYTEEDLGFSPYYWGNLEVNSRNEVFAAIDYSLSSLAMHPGPEIMRFDGTHCEQIFADSTFNAMFITIDRNDRIWCAGYSVLGIYENGTWRMDDTSFAQRGIFAIEQSPDGRMWIGTGEGIYISD